MRPGDLVASRFRILERAGAGGMGVVYRAEDTTTRSLVALKVLYADQHPERFLREAAVLAELAHPAVVRYVAHGVTPTGEIYLAMEWLDGGSLSGLVAGRRLSYAECLTLLRRICAGLGEAHERGIVHRDLKPGNILLPSDSLAAAKIIDFGIAKRRLDPRITERGLLIGTLAYMSPEQAQGQTQLGPQSDVFSLASLVYKVMTGHPPFGGGDPTAVLAKVLLDQPPPLREMVDGVPGRFDALLQQMLAKAPAERPSDARVVLDTVEKLGTIDEGPTRKEIGLTLREQRVVWVVMLGGAAPDDTQTRMVRESMLEVDPEARLAASIAGVGGRYDSLADGTRVASFVGSGVPRDEAVRAVRTAQTMQDLFPERPVAIASGLGMVGGRVPLGDAIDRGVSLLLRAIEPAVFVDDATAELLTGYVLLEPERGRYRVRGLASDSDTTRKLLGRPTTCVGRDRELATLEALMDEVVNDSVARAALVVAPAGVGKSRLRYELLQRAREQHSEAELLLGRAESVAQGSPFALLRDALRRSSGIIDTDSLDAKRAKIADRVLGDRRAGADASSLGTVVFLGELCGIPFPDSAHAPLASARQNPTLLGDAMRGAWLDFLARELAKRPVLLVLEDLHWGDLPTVSYVDAALSALSNAPLFVLGLARPEVESLFPKLWARREPLELRLGPLRKNSARALAREVLGEAASTDTVDRIVDLADGNAFFLEELIRSVAEGGAQLPETVIGVMQTRLDALGSEARRVLRAASVFGSQFTVGGVRALLGENTDEQHVAAELAELAHKELISARASSALVGDSEYVFRHAVLQETVYATLTPDDRRVGHGLAAEQLERAGAADAVAMAEHFERADEPARAARWYLAAAERALEGNDLAATIDRVSRALACEPEAGIRGDLHYLTAEGHYWRGEYEEAKTHAREALDLIPEGEPRWFLSVSTFCSSANAMGKGEETHAWTTRAADTPAESEEARTAQIVSLVRGALAPLKLGQLDRACALVDRAAEIASSLQKMAAFGTAWVHHGRGAHAYFTGHLAAFLRELELSIRAFDAVGDRRAAGNARANFGYALMSVGDLSRAEQHLTEALAASERLGITGIGHYVMHNLGLVLALNGRIEEGLAMERRAIHEAEATGEVALLGGSRLYLALILLAAGRHEEAAESARLARETSGNVPTVVVQAHAAESLALGRQGRVADALQAARTASEMLTDGGDSDETEGRVRWALVEALERSGDREAARREACHAAEQLRERARTLGDPHLERCFLENVAEHRALLALADASD